MLKFKVFLILILDVYKYIKDIFGEFRMHKCSSEFEYN